MNRTSQPLLHTHRAAFERVALIALVGLAAAACADGLGSGSDSDAGQSDAIGSIDVGFEVGDDLGSDQSADLGPDPRPQQLTWCAPAAVPYDLDQIPPLPEGFDEASFCEAASLSPGAPHDPETTGPTRRYVYDEADRHLEVTAFVLTGPGDDLVTYDFDEQGRVREVFRRGAQGWYQTNPGSTRYELNAFGQLELKVAVGGPLVPIDSESDAIITVQEWEGDQLLSRLVREGVADGDEAEQTGPILEEHTWDYDDQGRLLSARSVSRWNPDDPRAQEAVWTYHDGDDALPASVDRLIDGVLVERETWTFDDDGSLVRRTFESTSIDELAAEHGGDRWEWQLEPELDTYQRSTDNLFIGDPWETALPVAGSGSDDTTANADCWLLPRGPGHGYPDGEVEHQLGIERDGRPVGVGFAYGNDGYGWNYGDMAWYGHAGLGTSWAGSQVGTAMTVEATVSYASGVMVAESVSVRPSPNAVPVELERERVIENGHIVSDRITGNVLDDADYRELRFERDSDGHLVARELLVRGELHGRQIWERDASGRPLEHTVGVTEIGRADLSEPWEQVLAGFGGPISQSATWFWRYDGDLLVERGGGTNELHEERRYDGDGQLVEVVGYFTAGTTQGTETWEYDDEGRVTERCTSYDGISTVCTLTVFDEAGRVAWRESQVTGEEPRLIEVNEYQCTP